MIPLTRVSVMVLGTLVFATLLGGCSRIDRETCVPTAPDFEGDGPGYELIDIVRREVWATRDWLPDEFAAFSLPFRWRKNGPRVPVHDGGRFLRSPGCAEDGQFTYMAAFDRHFLQVVKLNSIGRQVDARGLIRRTELEKYHVLYFVAGSTVRILRGPTGEEFVGASRSLERNLNTPSLPDGWTLTERLFPVDVEYSLVGNVSVLRLENEDSYQGPLPKNTEYRQ